MLKLKKEAVNSWELLKKISLRCAVALRAFVAPNAVDQVISSIYSSKKKTGKVSTAFSEFEMSCQDSPFPLSISSHIRLASPAHYSLDLQGKVGVLGVTSTGQVSYKIIECVKNKLSLLLTRMIIQGTLDRTLHLELGGTMELQILFSS